MTPIFYFYTNILAPYMFHRWRMMVEAFPGSRVIVTRKEDPSRPWRYSPMEMDFPCINIPETIHFSNHLAWSKGIVKVVKEARNKPVIHLFEDVSGLNALTVIAGAKSNAFVLVSDGGFPERTRRPTQWLRWNLVGRRCFAAMAPGEMGRKYMQAWGFPSERIYNSYLSHDVAAFASYRDSERAITDRDALRDALGVETNDILALCVSRLLGCKRLEDLAESLCYLPNSVRERLALLLIGDGPHVSPLQSLQATKAIRFKWLPAVRYEEMPKYYAASDFLVFPSEGDIWGLVVNEALSMGKPVICTDRIGASELVQNGVNGYRIPVRDPMALARAIEMLVTDRQRRDSMSKNASTIERVWHSGMFIQELKRLVRDMGWERE